MHKGLFLCDTLNVEAYLYGGKVNNEHWLVQKSHTIWTHRCWTLYQDRQHLLKISTSWTTARAFNN